MISGIFNIKKKHVNYGQWKEYIENKYKQYGCEKLCWFKKYLVQRRQEMKPHREYLNIIIPIMVTLIMLETVGVFAELKFNFVGLGWPTSFIVLACIVMVIMVMLVWGIYKIMMPIWNNNLEENMLAEYIEVIDEMILKKRKEKKKK